MAPTTDFLLRSVSRTLAGAFVRCVSRAVLDTEANGDAAGREKVHKVDGLQGDEVLASGGGGGSYQKDYAHRPEGR